MFTTNISKGKYNGSNNGRTYVITIQSQEYSLEESFEVYGSYKTAKKSLEKRVSEIQKENKDG